MNTMRNVVAGLLMSLDGVVGAPQAWQLPFHPEMGEMMEAGLADSDAVLLGRRTYLQFAEMWPKQGSDVPMADYLNNTPKYVASGTLTEADWGDTTILDGDLVTAVRDLKQQPGKNIQIPGSPRVVRSLLTAGLVDELSLMLQPVVAGNGMRLFDGLPEKLGLRLAQDAVTFPNGVVALTYRPQES
jgi:dihydrofolate reductase